MESIGGSIYRERTSWRLKFDGGELSSLVRQLDRAAGAVSAALVVLALVSCTFRGQQATATPSVSMAPTAGASPSSNPGSPSPSLLAPQRIEAELPAPLQESAAAAAGGKLYVIGGFDGSGNRLNTVYVFDGSAWSDGPPLPIGLDHPSAATLTDHVYLSGGHGDSGDSARVFRLDGASWTEVASMQHARGGHALIAAGGRLYAIGGNTAAANVAPAEVYDPQSGRWSDLPAMPAPRNHVAGFAYGANACVAGGRFPLTGRVDCFNFTSTRWVRVPDLPQPTSGAGGATMPDGSVIVMGGEDPEQAAIVDQFARLGRSGKWSTADTMLISRHGFQLVQFKGRAWACGGGAGLRPVATCTSVL